MGILSSYGGLNLSSFLPNQNPFNVPKLITDPNIQKMLVKSAGKGVTPMNYKSKPVKGGTMFIDKAGNTYTVMAKTSPPPTAADLKKEKPAVGTPAPKKTSAASTAAKVVSKPVAEPDPWYYSGDDIAKKFGIDNKESSILKTLQEATNAKFNEYEAQTNRAKDDSLRAMSGQYDQYLQGIRQNRANAVQTGITKGTAAASELATMIAGQQGTAQTQQAMQDYLVDIANQRGSQLGADKVTAKDNANAIGQYLSGIGAQFEGNDVNRMSARLQAEATKEAARLTAAGMTNAAGASSNAQIDFQEWMLKNLGKNEWTRLVLGQNTPTQ